MFLKTIRFEFKTERKQKKLEFSYIVKEGDFFVRISIAQTGFYSLPIADKPASLIIDEYAHFLRLLNLSSFGNSENFYKVIKPINNKYVNELAIKLDKPKNTDYFVYTIRLNFTNPLECQNCSDSDKKGAYYSLSENDLLYLVTQIERDIDFINCYKAKKAEF